MSASNHRQRLRGGATAQAGDVRLIEQRLLVKLDVKPLKHPLKRSAIAPITKALINRTMGVFILVWVYFVQSLVNQSSGRKCDTRQYRGGSYKPCGLVVYPFNSAIEAFECAQIRFCHHVFLIASNFVSTLTTRSRMSGTRIVKLHSAISCRSPTGGGVL